MKILYQEERLSDEERLSPLYTKSAPIFDCAGKRNTGRKRADMKTPCPECGFVNVGRRRSCTGCYAALPETTRPRHGTPGRTGGERHG